MSADLFRSEGTYPETILGYKDSRLDNWTDALMLLTAVYEDGSPAYIASLKNTRKTIADKNPAESLGLIYMDHDTNSVGTYDYGRYWHGYLVMLKPLLYFMKYSSIRYFSMIVQMFLFICIIVLLSRQGRTKFIFPLFITWMFLNPISTMLSMQFAVVTLLIFVQILMFLFFEKKYEDSQFLLTEHFLIAGCMTSYLDLLTFPLAAIGVPIVFWYVLHTRGSVQKNVLYIMKHMAVWGLGYGVMWSGKWVLGSVVLRKNLVSDAVGQAAVRTGSMVEEQAVSYGAVIKRIWEASNTQIVALGAVVLMGYICWGLFKKALCIRAESAVICVTAGILPFIWYAVFRNHSYVHMWFAYRELAVTVFAAAMLGAGSTGTAGRIKQGW